MNTKASICYYGKGLTIILKLLILGINYYIEFKLSFNNFDLSYLGQRVLPRVFGEIKVKLW